MTLIKRKQIDAVLGGHIKVSGFSANGGSGDVTTALGTAVGSAGRGSVSVPLQVSADEESIGVVTGNSRVEINDGGLDDGSGNEVYGRLTESGGVYTLTYYSLVADVETAYSFGAATSIDFEFTYRFDLGRLPADFAIAAGYRVVGSGGGGGSGASTHTELVTVTAQNTLSNLSKTPDTTANVLLIVNNLAYSTLGNADFAIAGKAITWNSANAGFNIEVSDRVIAQYTTLE